jgi:prepilin-type N-terminal cleavage/methylation domain-containing protein
MQKLIHGRLYKAFSLIELMVVIAIIAVLAAIAVPSYKKYLISSKMAKAVPFIDAKINEAIAQASIDGRYTPENIMGGADLSANNLTSYGLVSGSTCGREAYVYINFDTSKIGLPSNKSPQVLCYLWHYNGVMNKLCAFSVLDYSGSTYAYMGIDMPGFPQLYSNAQLGQIAFNEMLDATTFSQRTCMGAP